MKKALCLLSFFLICIKFVVAQQSLGNVWHETGYFRGDDGIRIHADIDPTTVKEGGYYLVVVFYDENGNPIQEYTLSRRGPRKTPVVIQAALLSVMNEGDWKDVTVYMPFSRLRDSRQGRTAYYKVFLSKNPNGQNSVSESKAMKFYVAGYNQ